MAVSTTSGVLWEGRCRSRFAIPVAAVMLVIGVTMGVASESVGLRLFVVGVSLLGAMVMLTLVAIHVELTADALRVRYSGPLRWPSTTIRLADVADVEAITVKPLRNGGWGYRGSLRLLRRAAVNLRSGPGLRLHLRNGGFFVVTVDDPERAAALMAPLLTR